MSLIFKIAKPVFDPLFSNVSLLLHFDGADGSTSFIDSSSYNNTILIGNLSVPTISTTQSVFGGSSLWTTDTSKGIIVANNQPSFVGDFTMELWAYLSIFNEGGFNAYPTLLRAAMGSHVLLRANAGNNKYEFSFQGGSLTSDRIVATQTWMHFALVRSSGVIKLYIDGVAQSSTLSSTAAVGDGGQMLIGGATNNEFWRGYIDEVRFTQGVARYTSNFDVPTGPFLNA